MSERKTSVDQRHGTIAVGYHCCWVLMIPGIVAVGCCYSVELLSSGIVILGYCCSRNYCLWDLLFLGVLIAWYLFIFFFFFTSGYCISSVFLPLLFHAIRYCLPWILLLPCAAAPRNLCFPCYCSWVLLLTGTGYCSPSMVCCS